MKKRTRAESGAPKKRRRRPMTRTRSKNFKTPDPEAIAESVAQLQQCARECAREDHGDSLSSDTETDLLASVILGRAYYEIRDRLSGRPDREGTE